jgi:hypothetical protein
MFLVSIWWWPTQLGAETCSWFKKFSLIYLCYDCHYTLIFYQLRITQRGWCHSRLYVYVNGSNINSADPVVFHSFSIFLKYYVNILWKWSYNSEVAQECCVRFLVGDTYDLKSPAPNNSLSFSSFIPIPPVRHDSFVFWCSICVMITKITHIRWIRWQECKWRKPGRVTQTLPRLCLT